VPSGFQTALPLARPPRAKGLERQSDSLDHGLWLADTDASSPFQFPRVQSRVIPARDQPMLFEVTMTTVPFTTPIRRSKLALPILVGGATAGTLDLISAFITFGANMPRGIASGLLGRQASQEGVGPYILGILLHYFIAFSAAAIYCLASRKLEFLKDHFLVCGIFYGIAVFLVMNFIVLPLCEFHYTGPYQLRGLIQGLVMHMLIIGLPISLSLRKLSD
jgi:hypothetical protein